MESYSVQAELSAVDKMSPAFRNAASAAESMSQKVSGALSSLGKGTMAVGAVITAFGAKSLKTYGDFSSNINKAAVVAGSSNKKLAGNMKQLTQVAVDMGKELPISIQDASEAMVEMARQGASVGDIKKEFPPIARAAASAGEDLTSVATTVQQSMNIWGGGMKTATKNSATMAIVANKSSASIGDMQQVFANVGTAAKNMGFSLKDVSVATGVMTNAGIPAAQASNDLNHAFTQMIKPSKNAASTMKELGISYTDAQGNMKPLRQIIGEVAKATDGLSDSQKQAAINTLFGTAGAKAMLPLLDSVTDGSHKAGQGWDDMSAAVDKGAGSYAKANKYLQDNAQNMTHNVGDAIDQMKDAWQGLTISAMGESAPVIQKIAQKFANLADTISNMHGPLGDLIKGFIAFAPIIGPVVIAIGAFMTGIGKMFTVVSTLVNVVRGATAAFGAFNAVLLANPIVAVITAIVAVVAALVLFFTKTETGRAIWQSFMEFLTNAWNVIKETAVSVWQSISTFLVTTWQTISTTATSVWTAISTFFTTIWNTIKTTAMTVWTAIATFFSTIWNGVSTTVTTVWTTITTFLSTTWTNILTIATTTWNAIKNFFTTLWAGVSSIFTSSWAGIKMGLQSIWQGIKSIAGGIWNAIKAVILGPVLLVIDLVTGDFQHLKSDVALIWNSIKSAASSIWNGVKSVISGIVKTVVSVVKAVFNGLKSAVSAIWNGIKSVTSRVWNGIKTTAINAAKGLASSAKSAWNGLKSAASSIWNGMKSAVSSAWNGMKSVASNAARALASAAKSAWNSLKSAASGIWNGIKSTISSRINGAKSAVSSAVSGMKSAATSAWNAMKSAASSVVSGIKSAFHSLSNIDLGAAGRAIMNSFHRGLTAAWGKTKSFVSGIGSWIRKHKGPISYDKKLLIPAGKAIMNGLNAGLNTNFRDVQKNVGSMAGAISKTANNALDSSVQALNSRIRSGSITNDITGQLSVKQQPAIISLDLGGSNYTAFVDDISHKQGKLASLKRTYRV